MELWVRTQGKDKLLKIECVQYVEGYEYDGFTTNEIWANEEEVELGQYKTKGRCLEIIDEIQKLLLSANPKEAFMLVDCGSECEFPYIEKMINHAREHNFIAFDGSDGASVQLVQLSVLVYEMPKE